MSKQAGIIRNVLSYTTANILLKAVNFLLLPLISHYINPHDFGIYSLCIAGYTILLTVISGGLYSTLTKFYLDAKDEAHKKKVFSFLFLSVSAISFAGAILLYMFATPLSVIVSGTILYTHMVRLFALLLLVEGCFGLLLQLQKTKEEVGKAIFYTITNASLSIILTFIFVVNLQYGIYGLVLAQLIATISAFLLMTFYLGKNLTFERMSIQIKGMLLFSMPLIVAGLLTTLTDLADRFILDHFFDADKVGVYSFSYRIANIMYLFVVSFRTAWTPHAIQVYEEGNYSTHFGKVFTKYIFISLLIFLSVSLLIPQLFQLKIQQNVSLFNPSYMPGLQIIPIVLLGYLFSGIVSFNSIFPYVSGKSSYFLITDGIAFVINIALNFILIPVCGLMGAAVATLVSFVIPSLFMYLVSRREIKVEYERNTLLLFSLLSALFFITGSYAQNVIVNIVLLILFMYLGKLRMKITIGDMFRLVRGK